MSQSRCSDWAACGMPAIVPRKQPFCSRRSGFARWSPPKKSDVVVTDSCDFPPLKKHQHTPVRSFTKFRLLTHHLYLFTTNSSMVAFPLSTSSLLYFSHLRMTVQQITENQTTDSVCLISTPELILRSPVRAWLRRREPHSQG